jgi:hypothetical protein
VQLRIKASGETKYFQLKEAINPNNWTHLLDTLNISWNGVLEEAKITFQTKNNQSLSYYVDNVSIAKDTVITEIGGHLSDSEPEKFELFQNYPNPFNPSTIIKYKLPEANINVSLKIYDALGKEVLTLLEGEREPGTYETLFDASGLSSGVYIYRLQTDKNSMSKKMLLIK